MLRLASIAVVAGAALAAAPPVLADHVLVFSFRGTITRVEGTISPPPSVHVGGALALEYAFLRAAADAEPDPQVGFYPGAITAGEAVASDYNRFCRVSSGGGGSIWVIDNSALGDVYRVQIDSPADMMRAQVELVDAQSAAFDSDGLPENISLDDFDGKFDSMTITIEVGTPEAHWRIVGGVEFFQIGSAGRPCDINGDGVVNTQDFFDFLSHFFDGSPSADYNHDGIVNSQDVFDFLVCFLSVCR